MLQPRFNKRKSKAERIVWMSVLSHVVMSNYLRPHGLQPARLLCPWDSPGKNTERVAISFSRGSFLPRDWTHISCIAGGFFTTGPLRKTTERAMVKTNLIQGSVSLKLVTKGRMPGSLQFLLWATSSFSKHQLYNPYNLAKPS